MDENSISKNWGIIPDFYYDLIAKIPPGMFLFIMILLEFDLLNFQLVEIFSIEIGSAIIIFFILILNSFVLGSFLHVLGAFLTKWFYTKSIFKEYLIKEKILVENFINLKKIPIDINNIDNFKDEDYYKIYRESHDYISLKDEKGKMILPKISAENALCPNLTSSLTTILIIHILHRAVDTSFLYLHFSIYIFYLFIIILLIWLGKYQYNKLLRFHFSFLRQVVNDLG